MKAIVRAQYGSPDALQFAEVATPRPADNVVRPETNDSVTAGQSKRFKSAEILVHGTGFYRE
jgi:hypothetical protein